MSSPRTLPNQNWLIQFMQRSGIKSAVTGICFGLAMMAIQSALLNQLDVFDDSLWQMYLAFINNLPPTADMLAFMHDIDKAQQPWLYPELQLAYQSSLLSLMYIETNKDKMMAQGVEETNAFTGAYTLDELRVYFRSLQNAMTDGDFDHPVTMLLRSHDHAIGIVYDQQKKVWKMVDASTSKILLNADEMAAAVHAAFFNSPVSIFSTTLFSTAKNLNALLALNARWLAQPDFQQQRVITKENANRFDKDGSSQLAVAVYANDLERARELLQHGANPNQGSAIQGTPLCIAALKGNVPLTKLLIGHRASFDRLADNGDTPLIIAVRSGHGAIVDVLLEAGASVNLTRGAKAGTETALYIALTKKHADMVTKLLEKGADPNMACTTEGITPLGIAVRNGDGASVTMLLDRGADITKAKESKGESPLFFAAAMGNEEMVTLLLARGANPGQPCKDGLTPIQMARFLKQTAIVARMQNAITAAAQQAVSSDPLPAVTTSNAGFFRKFFPKKASSAIPMATPR